MARWDEDLPDLILQDRYDIKKKEKVCTCGAWTIYGKKCPISRHYDWCDLVKEEKDKPNKDPFADYFA